MKIHRVLNEHDEECGWFLGSTMAFGGWDDGHGCKGKGSSGLGLWFMGFLRFG